ncbi:hypothetical protein THAOC_13921, partial [Thalassiosira oceanica]
MTAMQSMHDVVEFGLTSSDVFSVHSASDDLKVASTGMDRQPSTPEPLGLTSSSLFSPLHASGRAAVPPSLQDRKLDGGPFHPRAGAREPPGSLTRSGVESKHGCRGRPRQSQVARRRGRSRQEQIGTHLSIIQPRPKNCNPLQSPTFTHPNNMSAIMNLFCEPCSSTDEQDRHMPTKPQHYDASRTLSASTTTTAESSAAGSYYSAQHNIENEFCPVTGVYSNIVEDLPHLPQRAREGALRRRPG